MDGKRAGIRGDDELEGTYMFGKDLNAATLLIRNSLGSLSLLEDLKVVLT